MMGRLKMIDVWSLQQGVLLPWAPHCATILCHGSLIQALGPWNLKARQLADVEILRLLTSPVLKSNRCKE